jgi:hypothetical protein
MATAGFKAGRNKPYGQHLNLPEYYQNAFELLGNADGGKPGDWYMDLEGSDADGSSPGFLYFVTSDGIPPPPAPPSTACAANHGSTTPCCSQKGNAVPPAFQCPAGTPTCVDYVFDSHFGW